MKLLDQLLASVKLAGTALPDALMLAGAAGVSYGASQVYQPAGWIVGGCFALVAGWMTARSAT